jgi:hypothetical protein
VTTDNHHATAGKIAALEEDEVEVVALFFR